MAEDLFQEAGIQPNPPPQQPPTDLLSAMKTGVRQAPQNNTNWLEDAIHVATGGLSDKAEAALKASGVMSGGVQGDSFSDRYHKTLTNVRGDIEDYEAAHPGWGGAKSAKAAGVVAPMLVAGPEREAAETIGKAALRSGKTGATIGGAYGFGGTNDESLGEDLKATAVGAGVGGVAGTALPVGMGIAKAPFRMTGKALSVFGKDGIETAAGRVLNESKTNGSIFEQPPLPNMQLTTGQATNDPGLLWLERNVSQATPRGATLTGEALAKNNDAIRSTISTLGDTGADASKGMSDALDRVYAARKKAAGDLFKQADLSNTGGMSGFQFNNYMKKYVGGLPVADQAQVPQDVMGIMDKMAAAKTQNLSDVQSVRSMLTSRATAAARGGDANLARILGGLADQAESFIDMKAANLGAKYPLYNQARANYAEMKSTFEKPPAVRAALGVDSYGADKVPVSATADHFIKPNNANSKGAKEIFNSYLNAIATKDPKTGAVSYDPAGLKAAQDAFAQKFLKQVSNSAQDINGQNIVSPAKMQKFLGDYAHVINSPMFTQPQRDLLGRIAKASQMASRVQNARPPGGGSDTFQKLQGDKFIDALVGPGASKLIGVVGRAGGAITGALEEGKMGAAIGFMGGEKAADLVNSLYHAPKDKVINLVTEAMHDPQLAQDLMMKASNSNAKLLPPPRRAKIMGILGAQASQPVVNALTAPQ